MSFNLDSEVIVMFDFALVRRSVQGLAERLKGLKSQVEDLQRQRLQVHAAPVAKDEIKSLVMAWLEEAGKGYQADFCAEVQNLARNPVALQRHDEARRLTSFGALPGVLGEGAGAQEIGRGLCAVFGPSIRDALGKAIDGMEWPANALSHSARQKQLEALDTKIGALQRECDELIARAAEVGINLE